MKTSMISRVTRGSTWLLVIYLSLAISGCTYRPAELSPEEARILQTREFNGTPEEVAKAISIVLQEMHYTLDNVDMGLGIITATRTSERSLAPISRESAGSTDMESELGTFCLIAGTMAVVGLFLAWIFDSSDGDDDDEDDDKRGDNPPRKHRKSHSHHHESTNISIFGGSDDSSYESHSYTYTMTINFEEISLQKTRIRLTVQGEHYEGPSIVASGPVQDQQFYIDFYTRLHNTLNR